MDPCLVKGHFFLGLALLELELYDEAIKHLQRGKVSALCFYLLHQFQSYSWFRFTFSIHLVPPGCLPGEINVQLIR